MIGYLLFGITVLVYIALGSFALQSAPKGGDYTIGHAYAAFMVITAYVICSLLLTIYIAANSGFNWISDAPFKRNAAVAILWLGMVAGVAYCTLGRTEYHKFYQLTGFVRWLSYGIYYGATWLPLLMLIPYFLFFKPELRDTISPNLFKIPIVIACVLGFLLLLTPKVMKGILLKSFKQLDERELAFNHAMSNINKYQDVGSLLYYAGKDEDEQIRNAAVTKIKAHKNYEDDLIDILERGTPYLVFYFLDDNKIQHPERFTEPIIKSFSTITAEMREDIGNAYKGSPFDVTLLLRVLDDQFKGSRDEFKPHIRKLQEALETPPAKNRQYGDPAEINKAIYKYREDVKNWLEKH
jgi:hypothetical protein